MTLEEKPRVEIGPTGLSLGDEVVPFLSGSVHYFRLPRSAWRPALEALKAMGAHFVDTVVPWYAHEKAKGEFDFGEGDPRLDVVHFLKIAQKLGLYAVVRVGPRVFAELPFGGIPERVAWDEACQARSSSGSRLLATELPVLYPLPSRASRAFHDEARVWLRVVSEKLSPLAWPEGPLVLVHADAESAHLTAHDQDFHPDAVAQYRRYLKQKYGALGALRRAHEDGSTTFETATPPPRLETGDPSRLTPHLDWSEFQEALGEAALYRVGVALTGRLSKLPRLFGIPARESRLPLDPARLARTVNALGLEYGEESCAGSLASVARRTTAFAARAKARGIIPIATRMPAGFAFTSRPSTEAEDAFRALSALAYGIRGLNVHMAVQRDRFIGGPIDDAGRPRPSSDFWTQLFDAIEWTGLFELERIAAVHILIPRSLIRLRRLCNALSPVDPERLLSSQDVAAAALLEGEDDPTRGALLETEQFLATLEAVLERAHLPFATIDEDGLDDAVASGAWTIVACPGALDLALIEAIRSHVAGSGKISVGPRAPERDASMRPTAARLPVIEHPVVPLVLPRGPATLTELIETTAEDLRLQRLSAEPASLRTTLFRDSAGLPRALFVMNPTDNAVDARAAAPGARGAEDVLSGESVTVVNETVAVSLQPRTVRLLALTPAL